MTTTETQEAPSQELGSKEQAAPPVQEEAPAGESAAPAKETPSEPSELDVVVAERDKARNDLKAEQGRARSRTNFDERIETLSNNQETLTQTMATLTKAFASGETAGLAEETDRIANDAAQRTSTRGFDRIRQNLAEQIRVALNNEDGSRILELNAPELASATEYWARGSRNDDLSDLTMATIETKNAVQEVLLSRARAEVDEAKKAASTEVQRVKDETEENDLTISAGLSGGSGGASEQELVNRYGRGESLDFENTQKAISALNNGLRPHVATP